MTVALSLLEESAQRAGNARRRKLVNVVAVGACGLVDCRSAMAVKCASGARASRY